MFNLNSGLIDYIFEGGVSNAGTYYFVFFSFLFLVLFVSYLLGSINTAILISRLVYHDDIRTKGSGNAGMTNMLRSFGGKAALMTLVGDLLKTVISVFLAGLVFGFGYVGAISTEPMCYVAGLFSVLGHVFPVYYRFKGGKGVLSTASMVLVLAPFAFLILFGIFAGVVALSKYVSLGSISAAVMLPVLIHGYFKAVIGLPPHGLASLSAIILAILIVWCHRANIIRISNRTENKLSFGKKED